MRQDDKPVYKGITFDSSGEMHFYWWCEELQEAGFISEIVPQPISYELSSGFAKSYEIPMKKIDNKIIEKTILNRHNYTPDFQLFWDIEKSDKLFVTNIDSDIVREKKEELDLLKAHKHGGMIIEVKPTFDQNNMTRLAVLNQKWVMEKYGLFVNIVIPEKLFEKTFTPARYFSCDKSPKQRKLKYKKVRILKEFLNQIT